MPRCFWAMPWLSGADVVLCPGYLSLFNEQNQLLVPRFSEELFVTSQNQECLAFLKMVSLVGNGRHTRNKQRFLTPGHQGWNDLHSLCRIGMEYYLLNNDDNNIIYWIMMIIMIMIMIMIIMMTMMIIGTATIMIMIIIITTTLTMTIMKMIMIKTAQTHASHCMRIGVFKTKLPGIIDIIETMSC